MLNINQKIELKRECIDIPQAIKSDYNFVEVDPANFTYQISIDYNVKAIYPNMYVEKDVRGGYFTYKVFEMNISSDKYITYPVRSEIHKYDKHKFVKFYVNKLRILWNESNLL